MKELKTLLLKEQSDLNTERQGLREQIAKAESRLREVNKLQVHVEGLLGLDHSVEDDTDENPLSDSRDIEDIAADILKARGKEPMHYRELAKEIQARGCNIPGVDKDHTLIARLVRDDRFVRPKRRGFYALKRDYPNTKSVGARKPRANSDSGSEQDISSASSDSPM